MKESRQRLIEVVDQGLAQAIQFLQRNAEGDHRPDSDAARFPEWQRPAEKVTEAARETVTVAALFDHWAAYRADKGLPSTSFGTIAHLDGWSCEARRTASAPIPGANLMKRLLLASALVLSPLALSATAQAQGTIRGAERGAEDGNRAAGPVGGVVGGAVGAATGTVGGVLGVDPDARREERIERREERTVRERPAR